MKCVMIIVGVGEETFPGLYNFAQIVRARFIIFCGFFVESSGIDIIFSINELTKFHLSISYTYSTTLVFNIGLLLITTTPN